MRSLFLLAVLLVSYSMNAQIKIVEDFDGTANFDWREYATKNKSALIKEGMLDLEVFKKGAIAMTSTDIPVLPEFDFKITMKIVIPEMSEKDTIAILFDKDKDSNRHAFIYMEDTFIQCKYNNGKFYFDKGEMNDIKFPKEKNKKTEIVIERKGGKLIVSHDNMKDMTPWRVDVDSPELGFLTTSRLKIDEVIVEQEYMGK